MRITRLAITSLATAALALGIAHPAKAFGYDEHNYYPPYNCQLFGHSTGGTVREAQTGYDTETCANVGVAYRYNWGMGSFTYAPTDVEITGSTALNIQGGGHRPQGHGYFTT